MGLLRFFSLLQQIDFNLLASNMDSEQTAPYVAVCSESTLFAIEASNIHRLIANQRTVDAKA